MTDGMLNEFFRPILGTERRRNLRRSKKPWERLGVTMANYVSAMQVCGKCGKPKIGVGSEQQCLKCDVPAGTSTLRVTAEDPGEEKINQMLMAAGVAVPKGAKIAQPATPQAKAQPVVIQPGMPFEDCVREALKIMQHVPMPKDVKQFKAVAKIVAAMEALIGDERD